MASVDFRDKLLEGLGGPWPEAPALEARILKRDRKADFTIETIRYQVEADEPVESLLLVPHGVSEDRPAPGVCVWHQHNGEYHLGKSEPAGLAGAAMHHTGAALAREGFVVLCPDALGFEQRVPGRLRGRDLERFLFLRYVVQGKSLAWKNILDMKRAVDLISSRAEVRADTIGCYGHSMGSTHAWLVGPWEPRLRAVVGNCSMPTYRGIHREELLHCFPNFVPGLYQYGDTPDIAALIAPRPLHLNFGELDRGSPIEDIPGAMRTIRRAYEAQHAEDRFTYYIEAAARHVLSKQMWAHTLKFFRKHLA
jgi:dienelactone hydrolase